MNLGLQKRLAAKVLNCSEKRVKFDSESHDEIKEAITKGAVRGLAKDGIIQKLPKRGISKGRSRHNAKQRRKGLRRGVGSRKGKKTARQPRKQLWVQKVRVMRALLFRMRDAAVIEPKIYKELYRRVKGGFFRSQRHIKVYLEERNLFNKKA